MQAKIYLLYKSTKKMRREERYNMGKTKYQSKRLPGLIFLNLFAGIAQPVKRKGPVAYLKFQQAFNGVLDLL